MRQCSDGSQSIDISKQKSFMALAAGNIEVIIDATHDTVSITTHLNLASKSIYNILTRFISQGKSCLRATLKISR